MADLIPWSVKVTDEMKQKIAEKLQETGLSGKEFMDALLGAYELQKVKEKRPEILPDLQELEGLSKRICSIYVNMGERISNLLIDKDNSFTGVLGEKDEVIRGLKNRVQELESANRELVNKARDAEEKCEIINKERCEVEAGLLKQVAQFTEVNLSNRALIEEYKKKNDTLTLLLTKFEAFKGQVHELKSELEAEKEQRKELQFNVKSLEDSLSRANMALTKAEEEHKIQIVRIREQVEFDKNKALLEQKQELVNQIHVQQEEYYNKASEYSRRIEELIKERDEISRKKAK